jgi:hypothetical protein
VVNTVMKTPTRRTHLPPDPETIEVALFPIPNVVAFPGTILPLHVFEPRYRQLVQDCVNDGRMVAVSHTRKVIHQPSAAQSAAETLRSNQATYKPHNVFSAGHCRIVETTPDGRILASVMVSRRLMLVDEVQSLPYRIVSCTPVEDDAATLSSDENRLLQQTIHARLIELAGAENENLARSLRGPEWTALDPAEYSFRIFQVVQFQADAMQSLLETQSVTDRLSTIASYLETR